MAGPEKPPNALTNQPSNQPDDPRQARLRAEFEADLRRKYGQEWLDENKEMLDDQWAYLKDSYFL